MTGVWSSVRLTRRQNGLEWHFHTTLDRLASSFCHSGATRVWLCFECNLTVISAQQETRSHCTVCLLSYLLLHRPTPEEGFPLGQLGCLKCTAIGWWLAALVTHQRRDRFYVCVKRVPTYLSVCGLRKNPFAYVSQLSSFNGCSDAAGIWYCFHVKHDFGQFDIY